MAANSHVTNAAATPKLVHTIAAAIAADFDVELLEVQFRRETAGWVLRLVIDKPGGVTVDDCAIMSREVGAMLEVEAFIDHAFSLEVSSPGLDRPLKKQGDFARSCGQNVRIVLHEPLQGEHVIYGVLKSADNSTVTIAGEKGPVRIDMKKIARARLDF